LAPADVGVCDPGGQDEELLSRRKCRRLKSHLQLLQRSTDARIWPASRPGYPQGMPGDVVFQQQSAAVLQN
jgi:hypothetical protein